MCLWRCTGDKDLPKLFFPDREQCQLPWQCQFVGIPCKIFWGWKYCSWPHVISCRTLILFVTFFITLKLSFFLSFVFLMDSGFVFLVTLLLVTFWLVTSYLYYLFSVFSTCYFPNQLSWFPSQLQPVKKNVLVLYPTITPCTTYSHWISQFLVGLGFTLC